MARKRAAKAPPPVNTTVTRQIDLEPRDWMRATWRPRQPLPLPARGTPEPFDRDACLARLAAIPLDSFGWWEWHRLELDPSLSREEAHFWLVAVLRSRRSYEEHVTPREVTDALAGQSFDGQPTVDEIEQWLSGGTSAAGIPVVFQTLATLLSPAQILDLLQRGPAWPGGRGFVGFWDWPGQALDWFAHDVFPHLTSEEVEAARPGLRRQIAATTWTRDSLRWPDPAFHLGALFGLYDEMLAIVTSADWPWGHSHYHRPHDIVFGLGSAALVVLHMTRLRLRLASEDHIRAWLAHTELSALDFVRDSIQAVKNKKKAAPLAQTLALVRAPELAPVMLELRRSSKAPQVAQRWLDTEVGNAVAGLLPVAAGTGPLASEASDYLQEARRQGHGALIDTLSGSGS
jgi:hypothetical protein